jgi:hypothetical protein
VGLRGGGAAELVCGAAERRSSSAGRPRVMGNGGARLRDALACWGTAELGCGEELVCGEELGCGEDLGCGEEFVCGAAERETPRLSWEVCRRGGRFLSR